MVPVVFPHSTALWLFGLTAVALLLVPGPAVLYVVVQSAEQGRRVGLASVAGIHLGTLVHVAAATVGLSALIVASAVAFSAVKYAGAAYLIYLGVRRLLARDEVVEPGRRRESLRRAFARGIVVNVLNPKTALFFLAFLPQFVDPDRGGVWSQVLVLGLVFAGPDQRLPLRPHGGNRRRLVAPSPACVALRLGRRLHRPRRGRSARAALSRGIRLDVRLRGRLRRRHLLHVRAAVRDVPRHVDRAALADHGHLHLAGIFELVLDLARDLV